MAKIEKYIEHLNRNILPEIDYTELDQSYHTVEKTYAKGVLNLLHNAMIACYGSEYLEANYDHGEDGYVLIPGVIQGKKTGEIALALLGIDLVSAGEHCETNILCQYGIFAQGHNESLPSYVTAKISERFMPYDYCYTAQIATDIHISHSELPNGIKEMLDTFQNYTIELFPKDNAKNEEHDMER